MSEHHFEKIEHLDDGSKKAICSCGWKSRRVRSLDGPSDAWMSHLDRVNPRIR